MSKQGRRVILIYKSHMYDEATLDLERCTHKSDDKARRAWLVTHLRQINKYEDVHNPIGEQQEDVIIKETDADPGQPAKTKRPPQWQ